MVINMGFFDFFKKRQHSNIELPEQKEILKNQEPVSIPMSIEPDEPMPFGYKNAWLAIKNTTPEQVIEGLELKNAQLTNWETGIEASYDGRWFVTPVIEDYVIVAGVMELAENEEKLHMIAQKFEEVLFFATHRVVELNTWAKYIKGQKIRRYYYLGDSGEVISEGELTPEELALGFDTFIKSEDDDWDSVDFADEDSVIKISKAWGVNTGFEKYKEKLSAGYLTDAK